MVTPETSQEIRFVLDVHLGRLARLLRMLGFDADYDADSSGSRIVDIALAEGRVVLTRSGRLLLGAEIPGYRVRTSDPRTQVEEILDRYDLRALCRPFTRCMRCNGNIVERPKEELAARVPPRSRDRADTLFQCTACKHVYWEGTHVEHMRRLVDELSKTGTP